MAAQKACTCNTHDRVMMNSDGMMRVETGRAMFATAPDFFPSGLLGKAFWASGISFRVLLSPCFMSGPRQNDGDGYYMQ